jgi:hypothetical protein
MDKPETPFGNMNKGYRFSKSVKLNIVQGARIVWDCPFCKTHSDGDICVCGARLRARAYLPKFRSIIP